jgi:hypothetical protein
LIFVSLENSTQVIVPTKPGHFEIASEEKFLFERSEATLAVVSVGKESP